MTSNDHAPGEPRDDADPAEVAEAAPSDAPAPKRRARKPAAGVASEAPGTAEPAAAGAIEAEPEVEKPVRRRKPKASVEASAAEGVADGEPPREAAPVTPVSEPAPEPVAPAPLDAPSAGTPFEEQALDYDASAPVAPAVAASDDEPAADGSDGAPSPAAGESGEGDEAGGRRNRNRRRRGKDRIAREGGDAQPASAEGEPGTGVEAAPAREPAVLPNPAEAVERFAEVLSGAYDAEPPEPDDEAALEQSTKRVLRPEPEAPKLHKVLAQSGIGSRRDMEQLILDGQVTVNDEVAHIGMRISYGDRVKVAGKPVKVRIQGAPARLLAYHKPTGEVVSFNDPEGRPTVFRRLPRLENGKWQSVGRLDINTEGLLLFSNSGELANQLMHPRFGIEREYAVRVLGSLDDEQRARLIEGVEIDGQQANFKSIEDGGGDGANRWYRVVITEGRNREVRKLFDKFGMAVSRLIRIRYGAVVLPRGLKRGVWVELGEPDLRAVRQSLAGARAGNGQQNNHAPRQDNGRVDPRGNGRGGKPSAKGPNRGPQQGPQQPNRARQPDRPPMRRDFAPPRDDRGPDAPPQDADGTLREDFGPIPNPLEQTFDRRFAKGPRRGANQGFGHGKVEQDFGPPGSIPNPLEQTFDKRFVKGSQRINAGFGRPDGDPHGGPAAGHKKGGPKQPDPMQTSVGYIGADAYFNKVGGKRSGGGNRGGPGGGGGGRRGR